MARGGAAGQDREGMELGWAGLMQSSPEAWPSGPRGRRHHAAGDTGGGAGVNKASFVGAAAFPLEPMFCRWAGRSVVDGKAGPALASGFCLCVGERASFPDAIQLRRRSMPILPKHRSRSRLSLPPSAPLPSRPDCNLCHFTSSTISLVASLVASRHLPIDALCSLRFGAATSWRAPPESHHHPPAPLPSIAFHSFSRSSPDPSVRPKVRSACASASASPPLRLAVSSPRRRADRDTEWDLSTSSSIPHRPRSRRPAVTRL
ncbi:hypothetical protein CDD83_4576 [Cordyceps sp. RAO-2017]|nr:hypothetical protein CDD83_4576 [Cordyceps sp. RAO-2017]